jgi:hypothetical protein
MSDRDGDFREAPAILFDGERTGRPVEPDKFDRAAVETNSISPGEDRIVALRGFRPVPPWPSSEIVHIVDNSSNKADCRRSIKKRPACLDEDNYLVFCFACRMAADEFRSSCGDRPIDNAEIREKAKITQGSQACAIFTG